MTPVPRLIVLTDRRLAAAAGHDLEDVVAAAAAAGAPAVLAREKDLPTADRHALLTTLRDVAVRAGARFLVASDRGLATELQADGVHLAADDPGVAEQDNSVGDHRLLVGRSCHTIAEVAAARQEGCHYVTISPVAPSATKPGYGPPLGDAGMRAHAEQAAGIPVLALGGVTPQDVPRWLAAGAYGVAVLGGIVAAADPGAATHEYLDALERA